MKKFLACSLLLISIHAGCQMFQPTWESLDKKPVPQWFKDVKFGIFIHWGVYSVPAFCSKGDYAEWYQHGLMNGDSARIRYHRQKFGNLSYYQFADQFKAELFNPDEWASLFEKSGAKYIVLTSKHHDGYCLWPNKQSSQTWGFPWNSVETGPHRDLIKDLFAAVRKTSVHPGMYYSLYEWFNPLWKNDPKQFVAQHTWPQMKELINTYEPEVFWTDGEWDADENVWKSKEFLTWLYNESPVKDKVVTIDRWGAGIRFNHGMVYSPEYQPELQFENHYWEENRGMGYSFGYNRNEDSWDYNSTQSLIIHLIDKVSRGGNFLLDIGPDEHGKIPPIMQERLLQIGEWMKINGEAIYNTTRWKIPSQWSDGRRDYQSKGGDVMLKLTIDPDPGYAVKELFYTYNDKTNSLYALFPRYPANKKITLKNIALPIGTKLNLLSTGESLAWESLGNNVIVSLPEYNPDKMKSPYVYVLEIENFGRFVHKPIVDISYLNGTFNPTITISGDPGTTISYSLHQNGKMIAPLSKYQKPFTLKHSAVVIAQAFHSSSEVLSSDEVEVAVLKYEWMSAKKPDHPQSGISFQYFEPAGKINFLSMDNPKAIGIADKVSLSKRQRSEKFGFKFEGLIKIETDGLYEFFLLSDDGSKMWIDDQDIVDNDGDHGAAEKSGKAALKKGFHKVRILYFDNGGSNELKVSFKLDRGLKQEMSPSMWWH